jgi:hypothetical protein
VLLKAAGQHNGFKITRACVWHEEGIMTIDLDKVNTIGTGIIRPEGGRVAAGRPAFKDEPIDEHGH